MIIEEIKKANVQAMKNKDQNLRSIYSVVINKYMQAQIEARLLKKEVNDDDMIRIIQKTIKELDEEASNYEKVGHIDKRREKKKKAQKDRIVHPVDIDSAYRSRRFYCHECFYRGKCCRGGK